MDKQNEWRVKRLINNIKRNEMKSKNRWKMERWWIVAKVFMRLNGLIEWRDTRTHRASAKVMQGTGTNIEIMYRNCCHSINMIIYVIAARIFHVVFVLTWDVFFLSIFFLVWNLSESLHCRPGLYYRHSN